MVCADSLGRRESAEIEVATDDLPTSGHTSGVVCCSGTRSDDAGGGCTVTDGDPELDVDTGGELGIGVPAAAESATGACCSGASFTEGVVAGCKEAELVLGVWAMGAGTAAAAAAARAAAIRSIRWLQTLTVAAGFGPAAV